VMILGLDASGKTSLLYRWVTHELIPVIPTLGFNVESVIHTYQDRRYELTFWDVGGCDRVRSLWTAYIQNSAAVVFLIAANDVRGRRREWKEQLDLILASADLKGVPVVFAVSKMDLSKETFAQIEKELRETLSPLFKDRKFLITECSPLNEEQVRAVLDKICSVCSGAKDSASESETKVSEEREKTLMEKWLEHEDEPDEEFISKLENCTLENWDHRTHLRLAWIYLTQLGRREGMSKIFGSIKNFVANSTRARKTTFHETMTYFWTHMVHYAIVSTKNPRGDFKGFLLMNPFLSNGGLYLDYYNKDTILTDPKARSEVVLPDKKPLPSIIPVKST
jgi:ADP-ribosylation factor protein 1